MFYFFTWRDIKVKYKQTYLGILWALLQPLGMMALFTLLFSKTWKIDTGTTAYPIFVLSGLILWNLFSSSVSHAGESMIQNANIIRKIYFPRLIIPGSSVLVALFDFLMGLFVFLFLLHLQPAPALVFSILFCSWYIDYTHSWFRCRDISHCIKCEVPGFQVHHSLLLQVLFFSSQVIYPLYSVQQTWLKYLLAINPVNAAIELFRATLSNHPIDSTTISIGLTSTVIIFSLVYIISEKQKHTLQI